MKGFTLIELLVTLTIMAIILAFAVPSYVAYIERSKLVSGTDGLSSVRGLMEQNYQNKRTYLNGKGCAIADFTGEYFTNTCVGTKKTFTWTASSRPGVGLGQADSYVYTIDQDGVRTTILFAGRTPAVGRGWKIRN